MTAHARRRPSRVTIAAAVAQPTAKTLNANDPSPLIVLVVAGLPHPPMREQANTTSVSEATPTTG